MNGLGINLGTRYKLRGRFTAGLDCNLKSEKNVGLGDMLDLHCYTNRNVHTSLLVSSMYSIVTAQ
jgi:hypothetical protein